MPKKILSFDYFAPLLLGLMWTWPFLYPVHQLPITTFYQEWGAALLGFSAGFWMLLKRDFWQQADIPRIVMLPLGLALVVLVQSLAGMLPYFEQTLLVLFYFLWAALLMVTGSYLRRRVGLPRLALVLASCLVIGGELNALAGILQHFKWHTFLDPYLTPKLMVQIYGNIAQPNHYANYLMLALVSILFLHGKERINTLATTALALPLLFVLALCGSRSTWLYLGAIAALSYFFRRRDVQSAPPAPYFLWLMAGFLLMNGIVKLPWLAGGSLDSLTPLDRMFSAVKGVGAVGGSVDSGSIRLFLWQEAGSMFLHAPLLGIGFGQYAWQHFQLLPTLHMTYMGGMYNNAHNLVFQVAAEMGSAGLLVLFGSLIFWIMQARRRMLSLEHWWAYALLAVLFMHSLLEYPLWYAYFLGIAALLMGMLDHTRFRLRPPILYRIPVYVMLVFGLASIQQLYENFSRLEYILADRPVAANDTAYLTRIWQNMALVQQESVLRPYAELFAGLTMDSAPVSIENKLALCERVIRFSPNESIAYKYVLLLALNNRNIEAKTQIERAIWSYPQKFNVFRMQLVFLAQADPRQFSGLLEYADSRYAAYRGWLRK